MSYSAWSVVAGETPTAAKWNLLGSNDASFNDGTGLGNGTIQGTKIATYRILTQAIAANTTQTGAIIQSGFNFVDANATPTTTKAITFPAAFTTLIGLEMGVIGVRTSSDPVAITDFNVAIGGEQVTVSSGAMSNTGFTAQLTKTTNFSAGTRYGFWWRATGV